MRLRKYLVGAIAIASLVVGSPVAFAATAVHHTTHTKASAPATLTLNSNVYWIHYGPGRHKLN